MLPIVQSSGFVDDEDMTNQPEIATWTWDLPQGRIPAEAAGTNLKQARTDSSGHLGAGSDSGSGKLMKSEKALIGRLVNSGEFRKLQESFEKAFGIPLVLSGCDEKKAALSGRPTENKFCGMLTSNDRTCEACLVHQRRIHESAFENRTTCSRNCPHGMADVAVPVIKDNQVIAFLRTGQVFLEYPKQSDFDGSMDMVMDAGSEFGLDELHEAYYQTRVIGQERFSGILGLLEIYAEKLSHLAGDLEVATDSLEPGIIKRTREFIHDHLDEPLSLESVAKAVHCNSFYLCKLFKKVTGLSFTEYINQMRLRKAKELLVNQELRISEVAMDAGFQSITHFNRVFRKVVGCSPTEYRRNHKAVMMTAHPVTA